MTFTVVWRHETLERLSDYYVRALESSENAEAITRAAARIDSALQTNPLGAGESRHGHARILFALPLVADFEVYDEEQIVFVTGLRYLPKPPPGG